jgi:YVTN family beta-propeller protein
VAFAISTPALGVAQAQDGYVTLRSNNKLLIYDPANPTVISNVIALGGAPSGVAVSPDGNDVYVIVGADVRRVNEDRDGLDPTPIRGNLSGSPEQIVVSPNGTKLFVTAFFGSKLHIIDLATDDNDLTTVDFASGSGVFGVDAVTTAFGDRVYVSLGNTDQVKVFDAVNNNLLATVSVGDNPQGVAASPLGDRVYVANFNDGSISVINTDGNLVIATIPAVGNGPQELTVSADGTRVYGTLNGAGEVAVIDTTTNPHTVLAPVGLGTATDKLWGISFSADGAFVVVAHFGGRKVSRINPADSTVLPTGAISGSQPRYVAFQPLAPMNTRAGFNIAVTPFDTTTPGTPVSLTFDEVTVGGNTTLATASIGPPPPAGFVLGEPPVFFDVSTTAMFAGNVSICINYTGMTFANESNLALWHFDGTSWQNATTSLDTDTKVICGTVSSLSVFVVAEPEPVIDNPPTLGSTPNVLGETLTPASGETVSFTVDVTDDNGATLSVDELPAGATLSPPLNGTNFSSAFSWNTTGADADTYVLTLTANDGLNPAVTGVVTIVVAEPDEPEPPPVVDVEFLDFRLARAQISGKSNHADQFWFNGNFSVDLANGDGINPAQEGVVLTVEGTAFVIPAGSFEEYGRGRLFRFHDRVGEARLLVHITQVREGVYNLDVTGWDAEIPNPTNPLQLFVRIGDDFGYAETSGKIK